MERGKYRKNTFLNSLSLNLKLYKNTNHREYLVSNIKCLVSGIQSITLCVSAPLW